MHSLQLDLPTHDPRTGYHKCQLLALESMIDDGLGLVLGLRFLRQGRFTMDNQVFSFFLR
ncbi:MAG: hypothetical protein JMN25_17375 [gamma proteobacterium endosymbiont of Lamellibrachia anaximandri]|nr:hypothetical protein [gamma proteobacterium endosymbiont of Lamellibrachia anaximandri]